MNQQQHRRADYVRFQPIVTRWHDNDLYGHVNNVVYYSYFDTTVNTYLIEAGNLDIHRGEIVGFVVSSSCEYFASIAFLDRIEVGLRVARLGNSSVCYELAIFRGNDELAWPPGDSSMSSSTGKAAVPCPSQRRAGMPWNTSGATSGSYRRHPLRGGVMEASMQ